MGCMSSKADINDRHPNIFEVININDHGQELHPAKLEITDSDIILHQKDCSIGTFRYDEKGRSGVQWSIRYLKRYGYCEGVFSFELGRRSPTGPGVYAFKCDRAEALFQLLQTCIQHPAEEGRQAPAHTDLAPAGVTVVTPPANGDVEPMRVWHGPQDGSDEAENVNDEVRPNEVAAAELPKQPPVPSVRKLKPTHAYRNTALPCDVQAGGQLAADNVDRRHLYENVTPEAADERDYVNVAAGRDTVNYADLLLAEPGGRAEPAALGAAAAADTAGFDYAKIDIDKTEALKRARNPDVPLANPERVRKTRHNSTMVEPTNLSRANSVIST